MDYKTSFAAIMSYALERDLISCSVAEVINLMKSEYKTEDFILAVDRQLLSLYSTKLTFGKYNKMIEDTLHSIMKRCSTMGWILPIKKS